MFEEVAERWHEAIVSDFFVIYDEVREEQTDGLVAVHHVIAFLQCLRGVRKEFEKHFIRHRSVLCFCQQFLVFRNLFFDARRLYFDLRHIALEILVHGRVVGEEHGFDTFLGLFILGRRTAQAHQTAFNALTVSDTFGLYGRAKTFVVRLGGEQVGLQEVEYEKPHHPRTDGLLRSLTPLCFATIIVDAVDAFVALLFVLGGDT